MLLGDGDRSPSRQIPGWPTISTGVCKNTPPDKKTGWKVSFENTESRTGLRFLLLGRMAKAHMKGMFFTDTGSTTAAATATTIPAVLLLPYKIT